MNLQFSIPFDPDSDERLLIESIPPKPAVFALFPESAGAGDSAPYLGRAVDLRRRLGRLLAGPREHSKMLNLRHFTRRIDFQCVGSTFEAQCLLYLLNRCYYPKHYRQRLRLKPPAFLKLNLRNRFPRCYPTRRLANDGSLYYGPFPSHVAAERFAAKFLDLFQIRRCTENLEPNPSHPGCIYSQMRMCLAPCLAGCTDEEYQQEVARVVAFVDNEGQPLIRALEAERTRAAQSLEFEQAARLHRRLEEVREVLRLKPGLVRNLRHLHAVVIVRGADEKSVLFFRVSRGELRGPATLTFDENVPSPVPLDQQLHALLDSLAASPRLGGAAAAKTGTQVRAYSPVPGRGSEAGELPPWEHLSLLARWYYSSFRQGALLMLPASEEIPHARLIRLCRKVLAGEVERSA